MVEVTVIAVFLAGIVSFLSPCVLPLVPGFLGYLSGTALNDPTRNRWKIFFNSVFFVLGFSLVFALLGVLLNTVLESVSFTVQEWLARIGGAIIILFGLYLVGLLKIGFLNRDHSIHVKRKFGITYITSFVFGAAFAVGWTPCVGAVLGSVLALTITQPGSAFLLLTMYSLGLGLPFLLVGLFSDKAMGLIAKLGPHLKWFNIIVGILLIIIGILIFTQTLGYVANFSFVENIIG